MEQRVVWELGRWQESREPIGLRDVRQAAHPPVVQSPAAAVPAAPRAAAQSSPRASAATVQASPRAAAATAPAFEYVIEEQAPPREQVVTRLPVRRAEPATPPAPPASEAPARKPAALTVAPAEPVEAEPAKERRKTRKARERAESKQRAEDQKRAEALERETARKREAEEKENARKRETAERESQRRAAANEPSRGDRRRARKHRRLTEGVTLHDGETITLTMSGWSRGRPAVLVVTRFRAILITKLPQTLHWIPLEEISQARLRWRVGWTLEIEGSVEFLTLQKRRRQTLVSVKQMLADEVAEALAPGGRRHHPEVTQDWCDRSIEMWETHAGQIRLFIRRHPLLVVATLSFWVPVAYYFALR